MSLDPLTSLVPSKVALVAAGPNAAPMLGIAGGVPGHTNPHGITRTSTGDGGLEADKTKAPKADKAFTVKSSEMVPLTSRPPEPGPLQKTVRGLGYLEHGLALAGLGTALAGHVMRRRREDHMRDQLYELERQQLLNRHQAQTQQGAAEVPEPKISGMLPLTRMRAKATDYLEGLGHATLDQIEDYQKRPQRLAPHLMQPPVDPALK